jgi:ribonuclease HII
MGKRKGNVRYEIGIDEAGRGPLAGPVAVGVVLVPADFDWSLLPFVGDSKAVSEKRREVIYQEAMKLTKAGRIYCTVEMGSVKQIDKRGIVPAITSCIDKGLKEVLAECRDSEVISLSRIYPDKSTRSRLELEEVMVKLDGGLRAPAEWMHQETIIKGDAKEKVIGLASIMAKVTRDRYMRRRATLAAYVPYDFARHKGYATSAHRKAIAKHGLSPEHRQTFCRKIISVV